MQLASGASRERMRQRPFDLLYNACLADLLEPMLSTHSCRRWVLPFGLRPNGSTLFRTCQTLQIESKSTP